MKSQNGETVAALLCARQSVSLFQTPSLCFDGSARVSGLVRAIDFAMLGVGEDRVRNTFIIGR